MARFFAVFLLVGGCIEENGKPIDSASVIDTQTEGEDLDGDGFSDAEEEAYGSDPTDSASVANGAPGNLTLDNESVDESQPVGAMVGHLHAFDPDANDTLTYSLAAGPGDYDNAAFKVNGNVLETAEVLDYETKFLHYVRLAADDGKGGRVEQSFVVQVRNVFIPIAKTLPAGEVTHDRADLSGQLLADVFSPVTELGVIVSRSWWFAESDPSTRRVPGASTGAEFELSVGQLEPATRYYYRAYAINGEGTALGAKKRFTTKRAPQTDPWGNAAALGDGWFHLSWFGAFRPFENDWIFHQDLGWAYVSGTNEDSVWLWSNDWGWLWTSAESHPHFHSHDQQSWLYFLSKDASGKPVFFHYGTRQWLNAKP